MNSVENDGQIQYDSLMGKVIASYAQDIRFKDYLEIGTWNGGGSTYCFGKGFETRNEPFSFLTLEINKERYEEAKEKYKHIKYIEIERGTILDPKDFLVNNNLIEKFNSIFKSINIEWLIDDLNSMFSGAKYIEFVDFIPEVVLLDGSEYLTYFEFIKLYNSTKVFILDDINTEKCKKIVIELDNNPNWIQKYKVVDERNGWAVYEKKDNWIPKYKVVVVDERNGCAVYEKKDI